MLWRIPFCPKGDHLAEQTKRGTRFRYWLPLVLVAVAALGVAAWLILATIDSEGRSPLERWVRQQILSLAAASLNPVLTFDAFNLELPDTVTLTNVALVAPDPRLPNGQVTIFEARRVTIVLAERPADGEPLRIRQLALVEPALRLVAAEPGGTRVAGFSDLLKPRETATGSEPGPRPSEVFELRQVGLENARIVYDPRLPDAPAMELDGITAKLKLEDPDGGWHSLALDIDRRPVISLDADGRFSLDDLLLDLRRMRLAVEVAREHDHLLPPQLQAIIAGHDVRGRLEATFSGSLPLTRMDGMRADLQVELTGGHARFGELVLDVERLDLPISFRDGDLRINGMSLDALGGTLGLSGSVAMTAPVDGELRANVSGMRIENLLASTGPDQPPRYAGKVEGNVRLSGPMATISRNAAGEGELTVSDGRFGKTMIVSRLITATANIITLNLARSHDDTGRAVFTFEGNRALFSDLRIDSTGLVARGDGNLYFDGRLDLRMNGGPIERVQERLGLAGKILGAITDQLVVYSVTGTLDDPKVRVRLFRAIGEQPEKPASSDP